jgi:hypothetical protein
VPKKPRVGACRAPQPRIALLLSYTVTQISHSCSHACNPHCPPHHTQEAWGWTAWKRWSEIRAAERAGFSYLESFKLLLAPEGSLGTVNTVCPLPAGLTAVQVVADFLTELRKCARRGAHRGLRLLLAEHWDVRVPISDSALA